MFQVNWAVLVRRALKLIYMGILMLPYKWLIFKACIFHGRALIFHFKNFNFMNGCWEPYLSNILVKYFKIL